VRSLEKPAYSAPGKRPINATGKPYPRGAYKSANFV